MQHSFFIFPLEGSYIFRIYSSPSPPVLFVIISVGSLSSSSPPVYSQYILHHPCQYFLGPPVHQQSSSLSGSSSPPAVFIFLLGFFCGFHSIFFFQVVQEVDDDFFFFILTPPRPPPLLGGIATSLFPFPMMPLTLTEFLCNSGFFLHLFTFYISLKLMISPIFDFKMISYLSFIYQMTSLAI
jgi:H+/Cl- antiporter ClcA